MLLISFQTFLLGHLELHETCHVSILATYHIDFL